MSIQVWQAVSKPDADVQWPLGRWGHAASVITDGSPMSSILIVIGGKKIGKKASKDCWMLDVQKRVWTKVVHHASHTYIYSISVLDSSIIIAQ